MEDEFYNFLFKLPGNFWHLSGLETEVHLGISDACALMVMVIPFLVGSDADTYMNTIGVWNRLIRIMHGASAIPH